MKKPDPLAEIKGLRKGWAFCNTKMLEGKLRLCQEEAARLPSHLQDEAQQLLEPLRNELSRRTK